MCLMGTGSVLMWSGPFPCYLRLASRLVGAGGQQQRRGGVHGRQRHRDGSVQQCGELQKEKKKLDFCICCVVCVNDKIVS